MEDREPMQSVTPRSSQKKSSSGLSLPQRCCKVFKGHVTTFAILAWLSAGMLVLCLKEDMHALTAAYVLTQMITTVGYGDVTVHSSDFTKFFLSWYVLFCTIVVGGLVIAAVDSAMKAGTESLSQHLQNVSAEHEASLPGTNESDSSSPVGPNFSHHQSHTHSGGANPVNRAATVRKSQHAKRVSVAKQNIEDMGFKNVVARYVMPRVMAMSPFQKSFWFFFGCLVAGTVFFGLTEGCTCSYSESRAEGCDPDNCAATGGYEKTFIDCWYMSCVTLTTIGFGDFAPKTELGRIVSIVWMLVGVSAVGNFAVQFSELFLEADRKKAMLDIDIGEVFDRIDKDGSGKLDRTEFLVFALMEYGILTQDDADMVEKQFNDLDADKSGYLTKEEVTQLYSPSRENAAAERKSSVVGQVLETLGIDEPDNEAGTGNSNSQRRSLNQSRDNAEVGGDTYGKGDDIVVELPVDTEISGSEEWGSTESKAVSGAPPKPKKPRPKNGTATNSRDTADKDASPDIRSTRSGKNKPAALGLVINTPADSRAQDDMSPQVSPSPRPQGGGSSSGASTSAPSQASSPSAPKVMKPKRKAGAKPPESGVPTSTKF